MVTISIPGSLLAVAGAALMALVMWSLFMVLEKVVFERLENKQRRGSVHPIPDRGPVNTPHSEHVSAA